MTTFTWTSGVSGDWSSTTDWSPAGPPGASSAALIDVAGTYTVTISAAETVNAVTLDAANADLDLESSGTLTLAGTDPTLTVLAGTLDLAGTLVGGTVEAAGGSVIFDSAGDTTLDGVTWQGPMTLTAGAELNVLGGLTVETALGGSPGSIDLAQGNIEIFVLDSETLNNATLNFGSIGGDDIFNLGNLATLTLGGSLIIDVSGGSEDQLVDDSFGGGIIDQGSIRSQVAISESPAPSPTAGISRPATVAWWICRPRC